MTLGKQASELSRSDVQLHEQAGNKLKVASILQAIAEGKVLKFFGILPQVVPSRSAVPDFGFAFDYDGVLARDGKVLPFASQVLQFLHRNHVPFQILTNAGGKNESDQVKAMNVKFDVSITETQFVQSHTPFRDLATKECVLVLGGVGNDCRNVANHYGFTNAITTADLISAHPELWPFNNIAPDYYRKHARPLPAAIDPSDPEKSLKVTKIFVYSSPRDWGLDIQLIIDLLCSKDGVFGTLSSKNGDTSLPDCGWQQDGQPKLYSCNPDAIFSASFIEPRLAQGSFLHALEGVWTYRTNGIPLKKFQCGKPTSITYGCSEKALERHRVDLMRNLSCNTNQSIFSAQLKSVYMIGDNPASDIKGANDFKSLQGTKWFSILVETGVYKKGARPSAKPTKTLGNVLDAVNWALRQEGFKHNV